MHASRGCNACEPAISIHMPGRGSSRLSSTTTIMRTAPAYPQVSGISMSAIVPIVERQWRTSKDMQGTLRLLASSAGQQRSLAFEVCASRATHERADNQEADGRTQRWNGNRFERLVVSMISRQVYVPGSQRITARQTRAICGFGIVLIMIGRSSLQRVS